jgi:anti-anti-sigma factor
MSRIKFVSNDGEVIRCSAEGDITHQSVSVEGDPLGDMLGEGVYQQTVLLSMEDCSYIDSFGVGWLLRCHKRFQENQGRLVLYSVAPMVLQVLRVLKLHKVFTLASDSAQARELALSGNA